LRANPTIPIKTFIRNREFFKISQVMETGAESGMWTFARYQNWMSKRTTWHLPNPADEAPDSEPAEVPAPASANLEKGRGARPSPVTPPPASPENPGRPIDIEPVEGGLGAVLRKLGS
jgi:twitching motility protein PilT